MILSDGTLFTPPASSYAGAGCGFRPSPVGFKFPSSPFPDSRSVVSRFYKVCPFVRWRYVGVGLESSRLKSLKVRASSSPGNNLAPIAPLGLETPPGLLLSQIMQTHPHLLPAAIDQQLENLQSDPDAQKQKGPPASEDLLYRRIAELKVKERQKTLEEIIYCLIVQKFIENGITMIPAIKTSSDANFVVDTWSNQEDKLEKIHSEDALEMIHSHLTLILGERVVGPLTSIVQISKLKLGKLYAASIMYGYFLKRVDERYQLERSMKTLPSAKKRQQSFFNELKPNPLWDLGSMVQISSDEDEDFDSDESKPYRLRSYVMYLDAETLQRYATIRSKEAISLIEKQTQALFGTPDIRIAEDGSLDPQNDEMITITFSGLSTLVLEAVAFGTFLWEAESYVESKCHFLSS